MPPTPASPPVLSPAPPPARSPARVRARQLGGVLVVALAACSGASHAADASGPGGDIAGAAVDADGDARDLRRTRTTPSATPGDATSTTQRERLPVWNLTLGLASDHDEDDHRVVSTPFILAWQSGSDAWWKVQLRGAGLTLETPPGGLSHEGFGNLGVDVFHHVAPGLTVGGGVVAPTDGSVGSRVWSEYGRVVMNGDLGPRWSWFASGSLRHQPHARDSVSDWTEIGYGQVGWKVDADDLLGVGFGAAHTEGRKPAATLAFVAGFPLGTARGQFALTQSVGGALQHTGVRFEASSDF